MLEGPGALPRVGHGNLTLCLHVAAVIVAAGPLSAGAATPAADYAEAIRRDAPVAWWRFEDANLRDGALVRDAQSRHDGTCHGAVRREDGPGAGLHAIRFDGIGSYIEIPHPLDFVRNTISVEFWFKSTQRWDRVTWPGSATFVTLATARADSSDWTLNAGSRLPGRDQGFVVASSGATTAQGDARLYSRGRLNDGQWHHLVWTRSADGANKLFVDGRLADMTRDGGGTITNGRPIQVGGDPWAKGAWFAGWLAELAFYDKVLEPGRVQAHCAALQGAAVGSARAAEPPARPREVLVLTNQAGLRWELARYEHGWALGTLSLHGKPVEAPARSGLICLRHVETGEERWLAATRGERLDAHAARFSGTQRVDGANFTFTDYEADSVWQAVEYWLNKHAWTGDADALAHAEADALLAFLMMCPKQLSWVQNPTQTSHAEQQHYLQYSNYCYTNAKIACLRRLGAFTRRRLYQDLAERVMQCGFWAQETRGDWMGCQYERLSDPWHGVSKDVNSKGTRYLSELAVEQALQLIDQGLAKAK